MKIIHVLLGKANPNSMNGTNKVVHYLATEQTRLGHDVEVWGLSKRWNKPPPHERNYALRLFPVTSLRFRLSPEVKAAVAGLPREVWVQLHAVFVPELYSISRGLLRRGIPYGCTPHGNYNPSHLQKRRFAKSVYLRLFERPMLRSARLVHAVGASELGDIRRIAPSADIVLVPNGQVLDLTGNLAPIETEATRPIFCFCGRLEMKVKGLDLLLNGFAQYRQDRGIGTLWLIGDWRDRTMLEGIAKQLNIAGAVEFFGAKFGDDKMQLLLSADALIQTSRSEGIPTACLEAAALKKPLIISKETNLGAAVEGYGAGCVLPSNTPREIAKALALFEGRQKNDTLALMGQRAYKMVAEAFSWPRIARELTSYYAARLSDTGGLR